MTDIGGFPDLLNRARRGEPQAWEELFGRVQPCLDQVCRLLPIGNFVDIGPADLTQEVWLRICSKINQFQGVPDDGQAELMFFQWVRQTARSVIANLLDARRTQRRHPGTPIVAFGLPQSEKGLNQAHNIPAPDGTPSELVRHREAGERVRLALNRLRDRTDRQIVERRIVDNVSFAEIAKELNLPYDNVRHRFHTTLKWLERELSGLT